MEKYGLECKWSEQAKDVVSEDGNIAILEWWKKQSNLECKWSEHDMNCPSTYATDSKFMESTNYKGSL
jgi:hypothetical protein